MKPSMPTSPEALLIHVAIVEDDPDFGDALSQVIQAAPDMHLTGLADSRAQGMTMLLDPPADVLLVDLGLPDGSGIDVIRAAVLLWPSCSVMVSTNFGDESNVMRSIEAGAVGYLLKDSSPGRMIDEIRSLASGGSPISPIIARQVLARFRKKNPSSPNSAGNVDALEKTADPVAVLSTREKEVLDFITKGFTMHEIAKLMQLSHFTVRTFVRRIYSKLKVTSKTEAIYEARMLGLLSG
ncbi:response regulator [Undibacterium sp. Ji50W]|uniref:response regulator n=1 Tax=Undibacterium sp. Ji50W TaxID=3413041 RepID=UPI003BF1F20F